MNRINHRRRRLPGAGALPVATALVAAVAIIAFGRALHTASASGSPAGVPSTATTGTAMAQQASQAGRPCSAADLTVTIGGAGAYRGHATQEITLTNHAGEACFIPGAPTTTLLFDDGSQQGTDPGEFASARIDLQPGQSALLLVGAPGTCAGAGPSHSRVSTRLALGLPVGGPVPVGGIDLDVQCGPSSIVLLAMR